MHLPASPARSCVIACAFALLGAVALPVQSQTKPLPPTAAAPAGEPAVQRTVVEDDNARIEEVKVRGAVRSITVKPKGPLKAEYEVLPVDAGRDPSEGPGSTKGATGRRVWRVLSF